MFITVLPLHVLAKFRAWVSNINLSEMHTQKKKNSSRAAVNWKKLLWAAIYKKGYQNKLNLIKHYAQIHLLGNIRPAIRVFETPGFESDHQISILDHLPLLLRRCDSLLGLLNPLPHRALPLAGREQPLSPPWSLRHRNSHRRFCHSMVVLRILLSRNIF